ncbi:MAG: HupE/UreJ family protein [Saccharospirillum sp.]|uniref:HupE/UreJ family protein n=1 Tax=Saccharospirillum sp. TaxID=2033801 RepID=UPI003298B555
MPPLNKSIATASVLATTLLPGLALAHEGHTHASGFTAGLAHPIGGLDHLLAMVAVGFWAAHLGGNARWQLPLVFVVAMVLGGTLAMTGLVAPLLTLSTEPMIMASSVVIGLVLAVNGKLNATAAAMLCAGFAVFHGLAHGNEMPLGSSAMAYAFGFVLATGALHGVGILSGLAARVLPGLHRWAGGFIALSGLALSVT